LHEQLDPLLLLRTKPVIQLREVENADCIFRSCWFS
jgi:hypothetical protein